MLMLCWDRSELLVNAQIPEPTRRCSCSAGTEASLTKTTNDGHKNKKKKNNDLQICHALK